MSIKFEGVCEAVGAGNAAWMQKRVYPLSGSGHARAKAGWIVGCSSAATNASDQTIIIAENPYGTYLSGDYISITLPAASTVVAPAVVAGFTVASGNPVYVFPVGSGNHGDIQVGIEWVYEA